ncbi:hypothetical protein DLM45_09785 [Hyphomicrobium methylovorum]|uniref:hypothetical protein n=1 Tax=Hyphomicrobium methylovorum TaxID=84 RepID=UPI0015E6C50D|nr:hypothetical protein [Hyphomicrobium methylovorum]MBA2126509.1 hypothetical protein [Hyphomicrobium methylovorum]
MKLLLGTSAVAVLFATASFAQNTNTPNTTTPNTSIDKTLPESMQIQQRAQRQYSTEPAQQKTDQENPSTEAPGNPTSTVGRNRIDPAAPSRQRLQIDEGQSARARENPDANAPQDGRGTSYNSVIRGAPSSSGTSTGESGASNSGVSGSSTSTSPSATPSTGSSSSIGSSPSSGSTGSSGASSGSAGGGSSGGGGGGGGS